MRRLLWPTLFVGEHLVIVVYLVLEFNLLSFVFILILGTTKDYVCKIRQPQFLPLMMSSCLTCLTDELVGSSLL